MTTGMPRSLPRVLLQALPQSLPRCRRSSWPRSPAPPLCVGIGRRPAATWLLWALAVVSSGWSAGLATAQEAAVADLPTIAATEASAHVGKKARVELVVESARLMADRRACFLNSRKNHRDAENFTVVIFREALARFAEAGIDDPANHFDGRTIRVRGLVAERDDKPQIVVETPDQIEVVVQSE